MWPKSNLYNYFVVGMTSLFGLLLRAVDCIDSIGMCIKVKRIDRMCTWPIMVVGSNKVLL